MQAHVHVRDCPVTCLRAILSPQSYGLLRSECALICGARDPTVGHAVSLYESGQLAAVRYVGPARLAEIRTCLPAWACSPGQQVTRSRRLCLRAGQAPGRRRATAPAAACSSARPPACARASRAQMRGPRPRIPPPAARG